MRAVELKRLAEDTRSEIPCRPWQESFDDGLAILTACVEEAKATKVNAAAFSLPGEATLESATNEELAYHLEACCPAETSPRKVAAIPFWLLIPVVLAVLKRILKKPTA